MKTKQDIVKENNATLDKILGLLDQVVSSERTWNQERVGYLIGLRNELVDIMTGNYNQLLNDSNEMNAFVETNLGKSRGSR